MLAELRTLTELPEGWDEAGGLPVSASAASASIPWLLHGSEMGLVARVMPLSDGALLAEWHFGNCLLQIEWSSIGTGDFDIAVDHELVIEDSLPSEPRTLFSYFLEEARTALPSR